MNRTFGFSFAGRESAIVSVARESQNFMARDWHRRRDLASLILSEFSSATPCAQQCASDNLPRFC